MYRRMRDEMAPLIVASEAEMASGEWSTIDRADGGKQWAYRGHPLYRYSRDAAAGEANGEGAGNVWRSAFKPIPTPPGIGINRTYIGHVLASQEKLTLYSWDNDKPNASECVLACTHTWIPMVAPIVAHGFDDWSIFTRPDGIRQWAFKGKAVYRYAGDVHPSETAGDNRERGWHAVVLEPPPRNPSWIRITQSDAGEVVADGRGRTLYTFDPATRLRPTGADLVPDFDRPDDWTPCSATNEDKPVGNWAVVDYKGHKMWAYKGLPLFTNNNDKRSGDLFGWQQGGRARPEPLWRLDLL